MSRKNALIILFVLFFLSLSVMLFFYYREGCFPWKKETPVVRVPDKKAEAKIRIEEMNRQISEIEQKDIREHGELTSDGRNQIVDLYNEIIRTNTGALTQEELQQRKLESIERQKMVDEINGKILEAQKK